MTETCKTIVSLHSMCEYFSKSGKTALLKQSKYKDVFRLVFVVEFEYICRKKPVIIISLILFYKQSTNPIFQTDLMTTGKELWYLSLLKYHLFASKTKIISPITSPYKLFFRKRFLPAAWKRNISIYLSSMKYDCMIFYL